MTRFKDFLIFVAVLNSRMKQFLFTLSFFSCLSVLGQVTVVVKPADTIVCFRDSIEFTAIITGTYTGTVSYRWQKNFIDITGPGASDSLYKIRQVDGNSQGFYRCIVSADMITDTSDNAQLHMHPKMLIDTLYRYNPLGCAKECKGQFKVLVSDGTPFSNYPPYIYEWRGGFSQDTIVFGLCRGHYTLTVTDSLGCSIDSVYFVDVLKSPKIDFSFIPRDTIYLTNPNIQVVFPDSMKKYITNWTWDFGDSTKIPNLNPAAHSYSEDMILSNKTGLFPVRLSFTDINGCDTTIIHELFVKLTQLKIPNVFTPNGDGINDKFQIWLDGEAKEKDYRQAYLGTELLVFDRWGRKVFEKSDYKSEDWDGANLSDGTYFYILKCQGQFRDDIFRGSVTILRGGK
jgi:gliding motility-associated-like protein